MLWEGSASPTKPDPDLSGAACRRGIDTPPPGMRRIFWLLGVHDEPSPAELNVRADDAAGTLGLRWMLARLGVRQSASERESDRTIEHLLPSFQHGRHAPADALCWPDELRHAQGPPGPESCRLWRSMLQELPARHRAALVLHDSLGLQDRDVADHLETTIGAVRRLVHQARLAMCTLAARRLQPPEHFWG